jgi:hypothetical protein
MSRPANLQKDGQPPTVTGYRTRDGKWLCLYCPYCKERHYHGIAPLPAVHLAHRATHCRGGIRLNQNNGYLIEEAPPYRDPSQ